MILHMKYISSSFTLLINFIIIKFSLYNFSLEGAAFQSRLPFDKMSSLEAASFPDLNTPMSHMFIQIRNRLLKMWVENPKMQLTSENGLENMEVKFFSLIKLGKCTDNVFKSSNFFFFRSLTIVIL